MIDPSPRLLLYSLANSLDVLYFYPYVCHYIDFSRLFVPFRRNFAGAF